MKIQSASFRSFALLAASALLLAACADDPPVAEVEPAPKPRVKQAATERTKKVAQPPPAYDEQPGATSTASPPAESRNADRAARGQAPELVERVKEPVIRSGPLNSLAQAMKKAGVSTCLDRINQVTNFLAGGHPSGASMFVAPQGANARVSSTSMEIVPPRALVYASADFAPYGTDECGAVYETINYWPNSCTDVASREFSQAQNIGPVKSAILTLSGGPNMRIFLMPAGKGCVAIKKEVIY
jgi:hypothetical protein